MRVLLSEICNSSIQLQVPLAKTTHLSGEIDCFLPEMLILLTKTRCRGSKTHVLLSETHRGGSKTRVLLSKTHRRRSETHVLLSETHCRRSETHVLLDETHRHKTFWLCRGQVWRGSGGEMQCQFQY